MYETNKNVKNDSLKTQTATLVYIQKYFVQQIIVNSFISAFQKNCPVSRSVQMILLVVYFNEENFFCQVFVLYLEEIQ